jgi:hypothetical protein
VKSNRLPPSGSHLGITVRPRPDLAEKVQSRLSPQELTMNHARVVGNGSKSQGGQFLHEIAKHCDDEVSASQARRVLCPRVALHGICLLLVVTDHFYILAEHIV